MSPISENFSSLIDPFFFGALGPDLGWRYWCYLVDGCDSRRRGSAGRSLVEKTCDDSGIELISGDCMKGSWRSLTVEP